MRVWIDRYEYERVCTRVCKCACLCSFICVMRAQDSIEKAVGSSEASDVYKGQELPRPLFDMCVWRGVVSL